MGLERLHHLKDVTVTILVTYIITYSSGTHLIAYLMAKIEFVNKHAQCWAMTSSSSFLYSYLRFNVFYIFLAAPDLSKFNAFRNICSELLLDIVKLRALLASIRMEICSDSDKTSEWKLIVHLHRLQQYVFSKRPPDKTKEWSVTTVTTPPIVCITWSAM